jgi:hypothetical protein
VCVCVMCHACVTIVGVVDVIVWVGVRVDVIVWVGVRVDVIVWVGVMVWVDEIVK